MASELFDFERLRSGQAEAVERRVGARMKRRQGVEAQEAFIGVDIVLERGLLGSVDGQPR